MWTPTCSFILFSSLLFTAPAFSQQCSDPRQCKPCQNAPPGESYTRACLPDWALNRTYTAATDAPIATAFRSHATSSKTVAAISTLLKYAESEYARLKEIDKSTSPLERIPNERKCNVHHNKKSEMIESLKRQLSEFGWGLINPEETCISQLEPPVDSSTVEAMETYIKNLDQVTGDAIRNAKLGWARPATYMYREYTGTYDRCKIWHYTAFRVNGRWSINTGITNDNVTATFEDFYRHYLVENLRLDGNKQIVPVLMKQRIMAADIGDYVTGGDMVSRWETKSTTTMNTWGGTPPTSLFTGLFGTGNNPAIAAAIEQDSATREQIEDATTVSGIAILVTPILLTMVPIALFADIDTSATLAYTLVTDILTVMPLAVKGIELLQYAAQKHEASRNWVYAHKLMDDSTPVAIEMWYARCGANSRIGIIGAIFLACGILFMIAGIGLEFVAKRHMERRKESLKKGKDLENGLGKGMLAATHTHEAMWRSATACGECECHSLPPKR